MFKSYFTTWKKAFKFEGRSSRKDYWFFVLITFLIYIFAVICSAIQGSVYQYSYATGNSSLEILSYFLSIFFIVPLIILLGSVWVALPLTVRRIRDVGMKWQWIFFVSIPIFGSYFVLIFLTRPSVEEINGKKYFQKY